MRTNPRPFLIALAALLALVLLPVAADRFAAAQIESRTAKAFQEGMGTPLPPQVHVRGVPVLTQVASGTLRHVDIKAHDIPADGSARPLPVTELDLGLDGVRKSDDDKEARARKAEATAYLSYADVSNALGIEISQAAQPGRITATVMLPLDSEVKVTTAVTAASGNRISFHDFQVTGGTLPAIGRTLLDRVFAQPIQLRNIPEGLHLRTVSTTATGLTARFSGESVTFRPEDESTDASAEGSADRSA
ncbi:LmeA family phospholipid-binding protein [Streptomyces sp. NPDC001002]